MPLEFKLSRKNLTDNLREGPPSTATTEDNMSAVRLINIMIQVYNKVFEQEIPVILGIGIKQVQKVLTRIFRHQKSL